MQMMEPGQRIGRYEILRKLGRGGMGTVYLAHDPVLDRRVAIKLFLGDLDVPDARERFKREARSAAVLNHPNIVITHDFGDFQSQPYIVMEYVVGESVAETIRRKAPVSLLEKVRWMEELCSGAAYAHEMGVVHRDIKPTNLMLDRSGRLKIVDFGVARMLGTIATNGAAVAGTPGYMAPEQILGEAIDQRCDLFSIGAVCYELLTYREAFPGDTIPTITHRVLYENPASVFEIVSGLDLELGAIVERALEKKVEKRFPDAATMREALAAVRRRFELFGGADALSLGGATLLPTRVDVRKGSDGDLQAAGIKSPDVGIAQVTPPRTPWTPASDASEPARTTDRINAALQRARAFLDAGQLDLAAAACEEALALDDGSPDALTVEGAIRAAAAKRRASALLERARECMQRGALGEALEHIDQARGLNTDLVECARLEGDVRAAAARLHDSAAAETVIAPRPTPARTPRPIPEVEPTVIVSKDPLTPTRTPAHSRPSTPLPVPTSPAERRPSTPPPSPLTPSSKRPSSQPSSRSTTGQRIPRPIGGASAIKPGLPAERKTTSVLLRALARDRRVIAGIVVVLVLVAGAVGAVLLRGGSAPAGSVIVDAVPWATVTAIASDDGSTAAVPPNASTPIVLSLPQGAYEITLTAPGGTGTKRVKVQVTAAATASAAVVRFDTLTPEQYFEPYLAQSAAPVAAETSSDSSIPGKGQP